LAALYVKFRDLQPIWDVVMQAGYFLTPIFWPITMVATMAPWAAKLLLMNPMAQMVQDARWAVVAQDQQTVWNQFGNVFYSLVPLLIVVVLAVISSVYFRRASKYFTERV
jgi:ABC-2 type transport system permease protein